MRSRILFPVIGVIKIFFFSIVPGIYCVLDIVKPSYVYGFIIKSYSALPFTSCFIPRNTHHTGAIGYSKLLISHIVSVVCISKVFYFIVGSFVVNMVNFYRPRSINIKPCKPMCEVDSTIYLDRCVTHRVSCASNLANLNSVRC